MTMRYVALCASAVLAAVALQGTSAHALTMAECSAKYKAAKADNYAQRHEVERLP